MASDRSGPRSMFVDMANLATKPPSHDDSLVALDYPYQQVPGHQFIYGTTS